MVTLLSQWGSTEYSGILGRKEEHGLRGAGSTAGMRRAAMGTANTDKASEAGAGISGEPF